MAIPPQALLYGIGIQHIAVLEMRSRRKILGRRSLGDCNRHPIVKAAKSLGLSQPTLGRHLLELEEQLGIVLFERTGRGMLPTSQAMQLSTFAREIESQASTLFSLAKSKKLEIKGRVRISASQTVACLLLPPILSRMQEALPEVDIDLISSNSISNLLRREADIALRMVRPNQDSLITKKIAQV